MNKSNLLQMCRVVAAVMVAALCLAATVPSHANLVVDPGFESDRPCWPITPPPWFGEAGVTDATHCPGHEAHSGSLSVQFLGDSSAPGFIYQEIPTSPGQMYEFSFWLSGDGYSLNVFRALWNDSTIFEQYFVPGTDWVFHSFIVSTLGTSTEIRFYGTSHLQLDDVSVTLVSEPASLSLLGLSLAGLGFSRRKR